MVLPLTLDSSSLACAVTGYSVLQETVDTVNSQLTVASDSTNVLISPITSLKYVAGTYTFRGKVAFNGGQTYTYSQVFTLTVQCGSSSTTMSFGSYPNSKASTQSIALSSADSFELPYMESSLFTADSTASCVPDIATLSTSSSSDVAVSGMNAPAKASGTGNTQIWTASPNSASTAQYIQFYIKGVAVGGAEAYSS